jgi:hypothetical protein
LANPVNLFPLLCDKPYLGGKPETPGAMFSLLMFNEFVLATPPRTYVELPMAGLLVISGESATLSAFTCFRGGLAHAICLHIRRESMAPGTEPHPHPAPIFPAFFV